MEHESKLSSHSTYMRLHNPALKVLARIFAPFVKFGATIDR